MRKTIVGKIIRIVDSVTAVINLGAEDSVTTESILNVMGSPEQIVDPDTQEILGDIRVVKTKMKATLVAPKYTVATTRWSIRKRIPGKPGILSPGYGLGLSGLSGLLGEPDRYEEEELGSGNMRVQEQDLHPWSALTEEYVKVGDRVEVSVDVEDEKEPKLPAHDEVVNETT